MIKTHKRKFYVFSGIVTLSILIFSIFVYIIMSSAKPVVLQKSDILFEVANDGDIICRLGDSFWSKFFKDASIVDKRYSHIGIIHINNDRINVIHSEGTTELRKDFVKEE